MFRVQRKDSQLSCMQQANFKIDNVERLLPANPADLSPTTAKRLMTTLP